MRMVHLFLSYQVIVSHRKFRADGGGLLFDDVRTIPTLYASNNRFEDSGHGLVDWYCELAYLSPTTVHYNCF